MKKSILVFLFSAITILAYSQDQSFYISLAKNITQYARECKKNHKIDKITVLFNSYNIVKTEIQDKASISDCETFFSSYIKDNNTAFRSLIISMVQDAIVLTHNAESNKNNIGAYTIIASKSYSPDKYELEAFQYIDPKDLYLKKGEREIPLSEINKKVGK